MHKKKWIFINPKPRYPHFTDKIQISLPLNVLMVTSLIRQYYDIDVIDERVTKLDEDFTGYDIVALSCRTPNVKRAYELADKAIEAGKIVMLGGVHPTLNQEESQKHCTTLISGEFEPVWDELREDIENHRLKPLYKAKDLYPIADLRPPDVEHFFKLNNPKKYSSRVPIFTTRGCLNTCNYCCVPEVYGKVYRTRDVKLIVEEIRMHQKRQRKKSINVFFVDDNICYQADYFKDLLEAITPLGISWNANISINFLQDKKLLRAMKTSGCDMLSVGFESLTPETISYVNKKTNRVNGYEKTIADLKENGIAVLGYFVFGFDTDTYSTFYSAYDFIMQNKIEFPCFTIATPFPGTPLYNELESRLFHKDWDKYDVNHLVYRPRNFDPEKFVKLYIEMLQKIFALKSIYYRLKGLRLDWAWAGSIGMHMSTRKLQPAGLL